jgi:hypothetical protein
MVGERWTGDPELATQGWQRHLLQVGYTDLELGRILDRLEETGIYDDALVVVVADHGVSFRPHGERRRVHTGNLEEIAFVPLFVKAPGQPRGEIVDDHVRTIDLLPTMADILGVEIPWQTDGRSTLGPAGEETDVVVHTYSGEVVVGDADELVEKRDRLLAHQIALFGEGNDAPGLYAVGPRPELLGRRVEALTVASGGGPTFESYGSSTYDPDSPLAPVRVYGQIRGASGSHDVAIAVNGTIVAVTRSFDYSGETLVSAVTPEDAYRRGENSVRAYIVDGPADDARLEELAPGP